MQRCEEITNDICKAKKENIAVNAPTCFLSHGLLNCSLFCY